MLTGLIIILISTVSITGQDRPCWRKRENKKYHGLHHSSIRTLEECQNTCETIYIYCWIIYYEFGAWYPCYLKKAVEELDSTKFEERIGTATFILDRDCYARTPIRPCWTHKLGMKHFGLYNSWSRSLPDCLDECQTKYDVCFIVNYFPENYYPCWFNHKPEILDESKFRDDLKSNTYLFDRSCLTSTKATMTTTETAEYDIDECVLEISLCDNRTGNCVNSIGTYKCQCFSGFKNSDENWTSCIDIDECWLDNFCENETTQCFNIPGSYYCDCRAGFSRLNIVKCADIDECTSLINTCSENSLCINNIGSYICECPEGSITYKFAYYTECQDIDECSTSHDCDPEVSFCLNLIFSYYCQCRVGYINVNSNSCEPIYTNNATTYQEVFTMITEFTTEDLDINSFRAFDVILLTVLGLVVLAVSTFVFYKIVIWCGKATSLGSSISSYQRSFILD